MDFLTNLSKRERALLVAAGSCILVAIVYRLVMIPVRDKNEQMDKDIAELRSQLGILQTVAFQRDAVDQEYVRLQARFQATGTDKEAAALFQESVQTHCDETGVVPIQIRPRPAKSNEWSKTFFVELSVEAEKEQLIALLYQLNNAEDAFRVDTLQLARKDKDLKKLKANLLVSKQVFTKAVATK